ncbi:hypothetical protein [Catellatospora chokoriensis]|uniref:Uncharacterized protein n=1 Tax=Catellatospora chokoriensis TaxID=310353 RepID=A0A8J3NRC8_9ACTN|nr:hypothetical protein [Catellatospora chokoriensis]GIF89815.1 hypothetical protein Cch02nite_32590 [Catellatospora chokoriensis]
MTSPTDNAPEGGSPTRVTANFTPRAMRALNDAMAATGDNRTDALNRAVGIHAFLLKYTQPDGTLHVLSPDGEEQIIHLL